jgi:hypothetical protein
MTYYLMTLGEQTVKVPCEVIGQDGGEVLIALPQAQPFINAPCYQYVKPSEIEND